MFSIIVPIYKVEKYLPQCIESILAQTYKHFELILVDDGSADRSYHLAQQLAEKADTGVIKVYKQPNAGPCVARNYAVSLHIIALHPDIINQVQGYVQEDEQQFERCKLDGSFQ